MPTPDKTALEGKEQAGSLIEQFEEALRDLPDYVLYDLMAMTDALRAKYEWPELIDDDA